MHQQDVDDELAMAGAQELAARPLLTDDRSGGRPGLTVPAGPTCDVLHRGPTCAIRAPTAARDRGAVAAGGKGQR